MSTIWYWGRTYHPMLKERVIFLMIRIVFDQLLEERVKLALCILMEDRTSSGNPFPFVGSGFKNSFWVFQTRPSLFIVHTISFLLIPFCRHRLSMIFRRWLNLSFYLSFLDSSLMFSCKSLPLSQRLSFPLNRDLGSVNSSERFDFIRLADSILFTILLLWGLVLTITWLTNSLRFRIYLFLSFSSISSTQPFTGLGPICDKDWTLTGRLSIFLGESSVRQKLVSSLSGVFFSAVIAPSIFS